MTEVTPEYFAEVMKEKGIEWELYNPEPKYIAKFTDYEKWKAYRSGVLFTVLLKIL